MQINEAELDMHSPNQIVEILEANRHTKRNWPMTHSLIRATSRFPGGKIWVLDPTGDQFGITQSAWELKNYEMSHNAKLYEMSPLGTEAELGNLIARSQGPQIMATLLEATAFFNKGIENWENKHAVKLSDLMVLTDDGFDGKRFDLLETMCKETTSYIDNIDISARMLAMTVHCHFNPSANFDIDDLVKEFYDKKVLTYQTLTFPYPQEPYDAARELTRKKFDITKEEMAANHTLRLTMA